MNLDVRYEITFAFAFALYWNRVGEKFPVCNVYLAKVSILRNAIVLHLDFPITSSYLGWLLVTNLIRLALACD